MVPLFIFVGSKRDIQPRLSKVNNPPPMHVPMHIAVVPARHPTSYMYLDIMK
jgi:hypothetical protein